MESPAECEFDVGDVRKFLKDTIDFTKSWFVRIHNNQDILAACCDGLRKESENVVAYLHSDSKRLHAHIAIVNYKKTRRTLRDRIILLNPGITPADFSIQAFKPTIEDFERAVMYMTKGKFDPMFNSELPVDYLEYLKSIWKPYKKDEEPSFLEEIWKEWNESPNKYTKIHYGAFAGYDTEEEMLRADTYPKNPNTFEAVRIKALAFSISKAKGFCSTAALNWAKQLTNTYCYRNKIPFH